MQAVVDTISPLFPQGASFASPSTEQLSVRWTEGGVPRVVQLVLDSAVTRALQSQDVGEALGARKQVWHAVDRSLQGDRGADLLIQI